MRSARVLTAGTVLLVLALVAIAGTASATCYVNLIPQTEKWFTSDVADKITTQRLHTWVGGTHAGATVIHRDTYQNGAVVASERLLFSGTVEGDIYHHGNLEDGMWATPILWVDAPLSVGRMWTDSRPADETNPDPSNTVHYVFACLEEQSVVCPAGVFPAQRVFVAAVYPDGSTRTSNYWYNDTCGLVMLTLENQRLFVLNKAIPGRTDLGGDFPVDLPEDVEPLAVPNPANPTTTITFAVERPGPVDVVVCDLSGRVVRRLAVRQSMQAGPQALTWHGRDDAGRPVASGIYVYRIATDAGVQTGRVAFVR